MSPPKALFVQPRVLERHLQVSKQITKLLFTAFCTPIKPSTGFFFVEVKPKIGSIKGDIRIVAQQFEKSYNSFKSISFSFIILLTKILFFFKLVH